MFFVLGFELLLILIGVLLWNVIEDKQLYGFTAVCAVLLLAESMNSVGSDGVFNYFRALQIITSTCGLVLLTVAAVHPKRRWAATVGSSMVLGYFAFPLATVLLPIHTVLPVLMFGRSHVASTTGLLLPFVILLLPIAPAAALLSLARALLSRESSPRAA